MCLKLHHIEGYVDYRSVNKKVKGRHNCFQGVEVFFIIDKSKTSRGRDRHVGELTVAMPGKLDQVT